MMKVHLPAHKEQDGPKHNLLLPQSALIGLLKYVPLKIVKLTLYRGKRKFAVISDDKYCYS